MSDAKDGSVAPKEPEIGFDELIERLQSVVGRLESGSLSLEESLVAYEQGVSLARRGHQLLDSAEKRVELLLRTSGGSEVTEPLPPDVGEGDH